MCAPMCVIHMMVHFTLYFFMHAVYSTPEVKDNKECMMTLGHSNWKISCPPNLSLVGKFPLFPRSDAAFLFPACTLFQSENDNKRFSDIQRILLANKPYKKWPRSDHFYMIMNFNLHFHPWTSSSKCFSSTSGRTVLALSRSPMDLEMERTFLPALSLATVSSRKRR